MPKTIGKFLNQRLLKSSNQKAIGWIENNEIKSFNFLEYKHHLEIISFGLLNLGLAPNDKISILSQTCKEWHFFDISSQLLRACVVPIYPGYLAKEIEFILNHSDSSFLVLQNETQVEKILSLKNKLPALKVIISLQEVSEEIHQKISSLYQFLSYKDLIRIGQDHLSKQTRKIEDLIELQQAEDLASIIYTSGTTGEPKGVVITQKALCSMLRNVEKFIKGGFGHNDRTLTFLPLSHVLGRCDSLLLLIFGWQTVYAESMDKLLENIQLVRPTVMISVPRIFEKIYSKIHEEINHGGAVKKEVFLWACDVAKKYFSKIDQDRSPNAFDLLEYRMAYKLVFSKIYKEFGGEIRYFVSGGAPISPEIIELLRYSGLTILEGYGLTETIAPCTLNPLVKQINGSVGLPMGDVQIKFAPDGEILIKSEAMIKEYYKNPKLTAEAIEEGWLKTGDIGEFGPEGYLKITDRKKDVIITSSGKNIAPQKIENLAKLMPHISHCVVIGDKRNYLTALIGIDKENFLSLLDDLELPTDCSIKDLAYHPKVRELVQSEIEEVNSQLPSYETIKKFEIVTEEFTTDNFLTPSLKVKRKVMNKFYKKEIEAMYQ